MPQFERNYDDYKDLNRNIMQKHKVISLISLTINIVNYLFC